MESARQFVPGILSKIWSIQPERAAKYAAGLNERFVSLDRNTIRRRIFSATDAQMGDNKSDVAGLEMDSYQYGGAIYKFSDANPQVEKTRAVMKIIFTAKLFYNTGKDGSVWYETERS